MALVTTAGSADADSYASLDELNAYLTNRVPTATLAAQANSVKEAALRMACRLLDSLFTWTGMAVDGTQVLTWPRSGMLTRNGFSISTGTIPVELKNAQCEFAAKLFAGDITGDNDAAKLGLTSIKAGSVSLGFKTPGNSADDVDTEIRRLMSELNWASKSAPDSVRQLLVGSWFEQPSIKRKILFGAM